MYSMDFAVRTYNTNTLSISHVCPPAIGMSKLVAYTVIPETNQLSLVAKASKKSNQESRQVSLCNPLTSPFRACYEFIHLRPKLVNQ